MNRIPIVCTHCGTALKGELDTFGEMGNEICYECWSEQQDEQYGFSVYGLAPHKHDMTITGSVIGSTVFEDYKATAKQDDRGRYWIEDRKMWFTPDYEPGVDGYMGMWEER